LYPSLKDVRACRPDALARSSADALPREGPDGRRGDEAARRWWQPTVTANVAFLGVTSLFTDVSSEMVNSVVPLFLTFTLGFTRLQLGLFNGAYQGLAAFTAVVGAAWADRHRRYKEVAGVGYGTSAATRVGLVAARHAWAPATGLLYADRAAKGLRTAPRDALISHSALPGHLGEAFGVHRALDTLGALVGPLVAFALLSIVPGDYGKIFWASFWIALVGLAVLILFVENRHAAVEVYRRVSLRTGFSLLRLGPFRRLVLAGMALSLVTIADALIYLTFQQRTSMSTRYFPLLFVGTALAYVVLALPLGRLADRVGPARVFVAGQVLLIAVDAILLKADPGPSALLVMLAALGVYYAATDGILAALASSILPADVRSSGLALLGAAMALAAFAASATFGAIWGWKGPTFAVGTFLAGLVVALGLTLLLLRPLLVRRHAGPSGIRG
jgi:MFS family permease